MKRPIYFSGVNKRGPLRIDITISTAAGRRAEQQRRGNFNPHAFMAFVPAMERCRERMNKDGKP